MNKLLSVFKSRKFWAAIVGILVMILREIVPTFPIPDDQVSNVIMLIIAYIIGVAVEDAGAWISGSKPL